LLNKSNGFNKIKFGMMETSKGKTISKPKKTSWAGKTAKSKKVTIGKSGSGEEEIRKKAREIYHERIARGEHGTAEEDWLKAEQFLAGSKK
jgi:hypothetical protein